MIFERIELLGGAYVDAYAADPIGEVKKRALLVIPGGGYGFCSDREGEPIALAYLSRGFNCFVLKYTVGRKKPFPCQLIEASAAIKYVKDNAEKYNVDPDEIFVAGFSAGGHLAASTGVLWKNKDIYEAIDMPFGYAKPKGVILLYPVISPKFQKHIDSFRNLWCKDEPSGEELYKTAIEEHVDADSSPAFIMHTATDKTVDVRNSLTLADAYARAGVPFELHVYPEGPHGISLADKWTADGKETRINPIVAEWVNQAATWVEEQCK